METVFLVALGGALAGFVQGLAGFGFGLTALAVWSWALEPANAVPVVVYASLVGQLLAVPSMRRHFAWRRMLPFMLGGTLGVPLGMYLLQHVEPVLFRFSTGMVLTAYCTILLAIPRVPRITHGGRAADAVAGWMGGLMGGFGGIPGPVPTLWCTLRGWPKDHQRSVFQAFNLYMHAITLAGLYLNGMITPEVQRLFLVVTPAMLLPTLAGLRLYHRLSDHGFRRVLLILLALTGVGLLVNTTGQVFARLP